MPKNNNLDKMAELAQTVVSTCECTGLIPRAPVNDEEYKNCMRLMKFSPEDAKK